MKNKVIPALLLALTLGLTPACALHSNAPTTVAKVADVATKVEDSAIKLLAVAQNLKVSGEISQDQLDKVAIAVDKVGHLGLDLNLELKDYANLKANGKDLRADSNLIWSTLDNIVHTLSDLGINLPQSVKDAINTVLIVVTSLTDASL